MAETQPEIVRNEDPLLFALDIGTRSVIGILGRGEGSLFRVVDVAVREHTGRAMLDGQIEDIGQVVARTREVKEELEARQNVTLTRVCVAAAGRALKTVRAMAEMELTDDRPITAQMIYQLEMQAVDNARQTVREETQDGTRFFCVGRSVVRYYVDGYPFSKIKGHKGHQVQADVIATFLPNEVVDSLYAAMRGAGLSVESLTLEPIAAMNAVIPDELRLLNLALVDIGAGTSDIALSEGGSVSAYTMATTAGDEITEEIIRKCLVDFETAERMKREAQAQTSGTIAYEDILGIARTTAHDDFMELLRPAAKALADVIAQRIKEVNGDKAPTALFLVGGGSKTPFVRELVAEALGLEAEKVVIGGNNFLKRVITSDVTIDGPEYATPLGIALTALTDDSRESFFVTVNGVRRLMFYSGSVSVLDALLANGFVYSDLMGKMGKEIRYELNGTPFVARGGHFTPAVILRDGKEVSLATELHPDDVLEVTRAVSGQDASLTLADLGLNLAPYSVIFNGKLERVQRIALRNGAPAQADDHVEDGDTLTYQSTVSLREFCETRGIDVDNAYLSFHRGGELLTPNALLHPSDRVDCVDNTPAPAETAAAEAADETDAATAPVAMPVTPVTPVAVNTPPIGITATPAANAPSAPVAVMPRGTAEPMPAPAAPVAVNTPTVTQQEQAPPTAAPAAEEVAPVAEPVTTPISAPVPVAPAAETSTVTASSEATAPSAPVAVNTPTVAQQAPPIAGEMSDEDAALLVEGLHFDDSLRVTINGEPRALPHRDTPYQFIDMLMLVDIDPSKPQGNIVLRCNGHEASYLEPVHSGDVIEIRWER